MRIFRAADHKRMPWKNGGGETTEVAVFPEGADLSDFDWRVSMARVDGDGPFSSFPGIDRTLAVLEGSGILLDVEGREPVRLTRDTAPHAFPADLPTSAKLLGGTVIDFNVMSRRGIVAHRVTRWRDRSSLPVGSARLVLCSRGSVEITTGDHSQTLDYHDAALLGTAETITLTPAAGGDCFLVEFTWP